MEIEKVIREFINDNLLVFDEDVEYTNSDNIFEMGFVNSLFAMKLVSFIESEFGFAISNEEMQLTNFSSVDNISKLVRTNSN